MKSKSPDTVQTVIDIIADDLIDLSKKVGAA